MRLAGISILFVLVLVSCKKEVPEREPDLSYFSNPALLILSSDITATDPAGLTLELDVAAVHKFDMDVNVDHNAFQNFNFSGGSVQVQNISNTYSNQNTTYHNVILMDNSGSEFYDPFNQRTKIFRRYSETAIGDGAKVGLAAYARDGYLSNNLVYYTYENEIFEVPLENLMSIGLMLSTNYGGESNIYDAIDIMLEILNAENVTGPNYLTVVSRDVDDGQSSTTVQSIINKANQYGIHINILSATYDYSWEFSRIAMGTGGVIALNLETFSGEGATTKLASTLGSLHRVLMGNIPVYRLNLDINRNGGFPSGYQFYDEMEVLETNSSGDSTFYDIAPIYFEVP